MKVGTSTEGNDRLETIEIPEGSLIHFSSLECALYFVCGQERFKGDYWSLYRIHATCPKCLEWINEH